MVPNLTMTIIWVSTAIHESKHPGDKHTFFNFYE